MPYESVAQALEALDKTQKIEHAYHHAMGVMYLDAATAAPKGSYVGRGSTMEVLSGQSYAIATSPERDELLSYLEAHIDEVDPLHRREIEVMRKDLDRTRKIPPQEFIEYSVLLNDAQSVWERAKLSNDFAAFAPYLEKIVAANRRQALYYNPDGDPYNTLLDQYEEGLTTATLDAFFAKLRSAIVPLLAEIRKQPQIDDSCLHRYYPAEQQRKFSDYLMEVMGLDREHCNIAETEHPFTTGFNNKDVRISTHYYEDDVSSSMFSVIHEGGHAKYELGTDDCYNETVLTGGVSMSIHESQSRFYENLVGRSEAFVHAIFPKMKEFFPEQLADVDEKTFHRAINRVEPSLIRTQADELTYPLHIMVRYELEKQLIAGELEIKDVPARWNALYKEYLGIDVPSDREGCLQDSHWSGGSIGYFPSYALGSAYGAQMLHVMQQQCGDVFAAVANGDLSVITGWLHEHIHHFAGFKKPGVLLEDACGKFDPQYYIDYLTQKYSKLYGLA